MNAKLKLKKQLDRSGLANQYTDLALDDYYEALELFDVNDDVRLNEAQQRVIFGARCLRAFLNHKDGSKTHYTWHREGFVAQHEPERRPSSGSNRSMTPGTSAD